MQCLSHCSCGSTNGDSKCNDNDVTNTPSKPKTTSVATSVLKRQEQNKEIVSDQCMRDINFMT